MKAIGLEVSPIAVAQLYSKILDCIIIDRGDIHLLPTLDEIGIEGIVDDIVMKNYLDEETIAKVIVEWFRI